MPISSVALSRTHHNFTTHLKNFELGTITETNPSNGVYRYTFADNSSPYTWAETFALGGFAGYGARFGINVGHIQLDNYTGAFNYFDATPNFLHGSSSTPKSDSAASFSGGGLVTLPTGRFSETSGTFASYLGDTSYGNNFSYNFSPFSNRMVNNSPVTVNSSGRYVEINWNQVALNETTYTTSQRSFGRTVAGKTKIIFQPYVYFDTLSYPDFAVYYGKPRYYNTTIAGSNLATLASSPPAGITNFNYPGGRVIGWTETTANFANPYIYVYKWNGSSWSYLREGYISDGQLALGANDTKTANFNTYTVPGSDGSGFYYIYIYQYDGYYNAFSGGNASNFISV